MRRGVLSQVIVFTNLLLLHATGQPQQESALRKFYNEYKVYKKKIDNIYDHFCKEECMNEWGYIDFQNKVDPLLNTMKRRYKSTAEIQNTDFTKDLSVVKAHFEEVLKTGVLFKEILSHDPKSDPSLANFSEDAKERLNNCNLILALANRFCDADNIDKFFTLLHDAIISDFRSLGVVSGETFNDIKKN
ncbi:uncharacterized protein VICG_00020, partial [Vittaforma corneae ATCC 50505]